MIRMRLSDIAAICDGKLLGEDVEIHGAVHDSRQVRPGMLFLALAGERVDGHDYLQQARSSGAAAALVSRRTGSPLPRVLPRVLVEDVVDAMGRLAREWRRRCPARVVAVTGSNGKTTVKEMIATILTEVGPVLATEGNYNNHLGVPLTLFRLSPEQRFAVLEMGCSEPGDIAYLTGIGHPDVSLVNNVGPAHLEGFGTEEAIAHAKGEIFHDLPAEGTAVMNRDSPWFDLWRQQVPASKILTFGQHPNADVRGFRDGADIVIHTPDGAFETRLRLAGEHNLMNALAATAAVHALGVDKTVIGPALATVAPVPGRLNRIDSGQGWVLIDDTYNANPASLEAGLRVLAEENGETWLVLGDMAELGPDEARVHADMGRAAAAFGIRRLFGLGPNSAHAVNAFGETGEAFSRHDALVERLTELLQPGVTLLVKGSRSAAMERVVQALLPDDEREAG